MINICELLLLGGLVETEAQGWVSIARGGVYVERWCLSIQEGTLPRWVLRGATITIGERSIKISDDGTKILKARELQIQ